MNSILSEDLNRENLALETAKCLGEILHNNKKVTLLHKELLEVNLSISSYIEESKKQLAAARLLEAKNASSSQEVVKILSEKCKFEENQEQTNMSTSPHNLNKYSTKKAIETNNNAKYSSLQQARSFITWYKHMVDNERANLSLYLSDDAVLEWFGRTIKTRKKVSAFLKFDMQCSRHDFTTVENIDKVSTRNDKLQRKEDLNISSPFNSPELIKTVRPNKRKLFQSKCSSPEWADGCNSPEETNKKSKPGPKNCTQVTNSRKRLFSDEESEMNSKGDSMQRQSKRKCVEDTVTPPNKEVGQGDCMPSTSETDSDRSHDALNAQLPKLAVECNGFIEFTRSRNSRNVVSDSMKWERKCKVQICYSEDPLNVGEYVIWMLRYTDETKCRRNLLAAFEEVAGEELKNG